MNISKCLAALSVLVMIGVGCQSNHTYASKNGQTAPSNSDVTYTVEIIPNPPRLSATSREGDNSGEVYSSNIVAIYVHHRGDSTNNDAVTGQSAPK